MHQSVKRLIVVLFTLLLGLSLLQGAMASFVDSVEQQGNSHQITATFDSVMPASSDLLAQDYRQCNENFSHSNSSDECTTCALELPPIVSHSTDPGTTPVALQTGEAVVKQRATFIFRPPKI